MYPTAVGCLLFRVWSPDAQNRCGICGRGFLWQDRARVRVLLALLEDVMYESLFDELRTKQQLGYSVGCSMRETCPNNPIL